MKNVSDVSCGGYFTIFLTQNGDAYACGNNASGQLGIGNVKLLTNCTSRPSKVILSHIMKISAGYNHTLFLVGNTNTENCYCCGDNGSGELGIINTRQEFFPRQIPYFKPIFIVDISAGRGFSLFLTKSGDVYGCGRNNDGRLGVIIKSTNKTVREPVHVPINGVIKGVFAGGYHSYFLGHANKENVPTVWACGANDVGQLGLGHTKDSKTPTPIEYFRDKKIEIRDISCSREHTIFITKENDVYVVGNNKYGQLMHLPTDIQNAKKPLKLDKIEGKNFRDVFTGDDNTFFVTEDGDVYISGKYESTKKNTTVSKIVLNFKSQVKIIRGGKYHVVILTMDGKYYSCGKNQEGSLGLGNYVNTKQFCEVKLMNKYVVSKKKKSKKKDILYPYFDNKTVENSDSDEIMPELIKDNWKQEIEWERRIEQARYQDQQKIKELEKRLSTRKKLQDNSPVSKYLYNDEIRFLEKKNNKLEKGNSKLKKLVTEKDEKIKEFSRYNLSLSDDNKILLKTKSEYQKILNLRERENSKYREKIKGLEAYINQITQGKKSKKNITEEELKDIKKWRNDRDDLITCFTALKEKLLQDRDKYNKMKERLENYQ